MEQPSRRAENRIPVRWRGRVLLAHSQIHEARIVDISSAGFGACLPVPLQLNNVHLWAIATLAPDGKEKVVTGQATTVHVVMSGNEYRVGTLWRQIDPQDRAYLLQRAER